MDVVRRRSRRLIHVAGVFGTAVVVVLGGLTACDREQHRASGPQTVQVSRSGCGAGWHATSAGPARLVVHNGDSEPGEVRLIDPRSGAVFADVEDLGRGASTDLDVTLGAGHYALQCLIEDQAPVTGRTQIVTGALPAGASAAPGVVPVSQADLIPATKAYERYVSGQLPGLAGAVETLQRAVAHGTRGAAQHDWLTAHLCYERLGAAYDAFGDLDAAINGLRSPGWTGFHLIEYGLWHDTPLRGVAGQVTTLAHDVASLRTHFAQAQIDPLQLGIRAHEISENALEFSLSGRDDYGSHTDVDTIRANLDGTEVVLGLVRPLLTSRHIDLGAIDAAIARTRAELSARPVAHEQLQAALGQLCELLAPVASVLQPRRIT